MTRITTIAGALLATTTLATAAPLDRSGQSVDDILFAEGNYVELSFSNVMPDASGEPGPFIPGGGTGNITEDYSNLGFGVKYDLTDRLSVALIYDQPFGVDTFYEEPGNFLSGTEAHLDTQAITGLLKYSFPQNTSVFGGLRYQELEANATVAALGQPTYTVESESDRALGYVLGVAYERPEIALRVALTYNSEIEHDTTVSETSGGADIGPIFGDDISVSTPQSVNLEAQTGVAPGTLVFGSIRWVDYSEFEIAPPGFTTTNGRPLSSYDNDLWFYTLGVGRAVTEKLSVAASVEYVTEERDIVSALSPSDGRTSLGLGATYDVTESLEVGVGARYIWLGDAETGADGTVFNVFEDNTAFAAGFSIGYSF